MRDEGVSDGKLYTFKAVKGTCLRTSKPPIRAPAILKIPNSCELSLEGNETALMSLIAQYGPVAGVLGEMSFNLLTKFVLIHFFLGITEGFTSYKSGVFYDPMCSDWLAHSIVRRFFHDFVISENILFRHLLATALTRTTATTGSSETLGVDDQNFSFTAF